MKKGQGISVNMMILIVMGLIVLIIAILLITRSGKTGNDTIDNTLNCNSPRHCADTCSSTEVESIGKCSIPTQVCCVTKS